jgi:hypothetical protein
VPCFLAATDRSILILQGVQREPCSGGVCNDATHQASRPRRRRRRRCKFAGAQLAEKQSQVVGPTIAVSYRKCDLLTSALFWGGKILFNQLARSISPRRCSSPLNESQLPSENDSLSLSLFSQFKTVVIHVCSETTQRIWSSGLLELAACADQWSLIRFDFRAVHVRVLLTGWFFICIYTYITINVYTGLCIYTIYIHTTKDLIAYIDDWVCNKIISIIREIRWKV